MDYLDTTEVAIELGVSQCRVRQLIAIGRLKATKVGDKYRGNWFIAPRDLEAFKKNRRGPGRPRK